VGRVVDRSDEDARDMDKPFHREADHDDGRNSGRRPASCQRGELGVARRELPVVAPQPDIVPFVSKRVNDKSLHVVCNEDEPTAVPPLSEVMNAVAEATGIASAR
jgi:hypothetical protein